MFTNPTCVSNKNHLLNTIYMKNLLNISEIKVEFVPKFKLSECPQVHSSMDAYEVLMQVWDKSLMDFVEESRVIVMYGKNRVLGIANIDVTGKRSAPMDMKAVFSIALKSSASKIVLAHNRPSENLSINLPSRYILHKIMKLRRFFELELFD